MDKPKSLRIKPLSEKIKTYIYISIVVIGFTMIVMVIVYFINEPNDLKAKIIELKHEIDKEDCNQLKARSKGYEGLYPFDYVIEAQNYVIQKLKELNC